MDQHEEQGFHSFFRGIILFGFTLLFLSLILTGNITYYIAPRMMPFIYFAMAIFLLLSVLQVLRSLAKKPDQEADCGCEGYHHMPKGRWKKVAIYSIFIIPLLTGFLLPDKMLDSSVAANRGVQLSQDVFSNQQSTNADKYEDATQLAELPPLNGSQSSDATNTGQADRDTSNRTSDDYLAELNKRTSSNINSDDDVEHASYDELSAGNNKYYDQFLQEALENDYVVINEENFLDMMTVLDLYLEDLRGLEVTIKGFTYREEGLANDQLVVARFSMTCCTADSAVYGILSTGEQSKSFDEDTWVQVTGTLTEADFNGWAIPALDIKDIHEVEAPASPYVYPSFSW